MSPVARGVGVIGRIWTARAGSSSAADAYEEVFRTVVRDELAAVPGFRGAYLMRRDEGEDVAFVTVTLFGSVDDIAAFAGTDPEKANVSAAARAVLVDVDERARHFEVVAELPATGQP